MDRPGPGTRDQRSYCRRVQDHRGYKQPEPGPALCSIIQLFHWRFFMQCRRVSVSVSRTTAVTSNPALVTLHCCVAIFSCCLLVRRQWRFFM